MYKMEGLTDFQFYLQFTKPLILNLPELNDRILAAAWIKKLILTNDDENLRTQCLKSLLFVIQRKKLCEPFSIHPNVGPTLEEIEQLKLPELAERIFKKRILDSQKKLPPFTTDCSGDLTEYVASQEIPKFGIQVYYAFSNKPLPKWDRVEKGVFPKVTKNAIESPDEAIKLIETISKAQMRGEGDTAEEGSAKIQSSEPSDNKNEEAFEKAPKKVCFAGKSLLGDRPPTTPLGAIPQSDDRSPPTWGSNLLQVKELPTKLSSTGDEDNTKSSSYQIVKRTSSQRISFSPSSLTIESNIECFSASLLGTDLNAAFLEEEAEPDLDFETPPQASEPKLPKVPKILRHGKKVLKRAVSVTKPVGPRKDARIDVILDKAAKLAGKKEPQPELEYEYYEEIIEEPEPKPLKSRMPPKGVKKPVVRGIRKPHNPLPVRARQSQTQPPPPSPPKQQKPLVRGQKPGGKQRGPSEVKRRKKPTAPSKESAPILAEAQAAQAEIQEIYNHFSPDWYVTPPQFSKDPEIRRKVKGIEYHPKHFGLQDDIQWQNGPDYLAQEDGIIRSPYRYQRYEGFERAFPKIQREEEAERFFASETLDDESDFSTPERSFEKLKAVSRRFDNLEVESLALAGVPVTSPKPTSSPRRSETLKPINLFTEDFPGYESPDYSPEIQQKIEDPHGLPKLIKHQLRTPSPLKPDGRRRKKTPVAKKIKSTDAHRSALVEVIKTTVSKPELDTKRQIENVIAAAESQYAALDQSPLRLKKSPEYKKFQYDSPKYERAQYVIPKSPKQLIYVREVTSELLDTLPPLEYFQTKMDDEHKSSTVPSYERIEKEIILQDLSPPIQDILSVHEYTEGFFDKKRPKQTKRLQIGSKRRKLRRRSSKPKVGTIEEWEEELIDIKSPTRFQQTPIPEYKTPPRRIRAVRAVAPQIDRRLEKLYDQLFSPEKAAKLKQVARNLENEAGPSSQLDYISPPYVRTPPMRKLSTGSKLMVLLETPPKEIYRPDDYDDYYQDLLSPPSGNILVESFSYLNASQQLITSPSLRKLSTPPKLHRHQLKMHTPPTLSPPPPDVYREMLRRHKRVPYKVPYARWIGNRIVDRRSLGTIYPTIDEVPETREEKLKKWRERIQSSQGKMQRRSISKRVLDKGIQRPILKTVTEHIFYPESPVSAKSPGDESQLPYIRKTGSRQIRRKISRRRIDFDHPEEDTKSVIAEIIERIEKRVGPLPELSPEEREPLTLLETDNIGDEHVPLQVERQLPGYKSPPRLKLRKRSPKLQPVQISKVTSAIYFEDQPGLVQDDLSPVTPTDLPICYSKTTLTYDSPKTPEMKRDLLYEEQEPEIYRSPVSPLKQPEIVQIALKDSCPPHGNIYRQPIVLYDYSQNKRIPLRRCYRYIDTNLSPVLEADESPIYDPYGLPRLVRKSLSRESYVYRTPPKRKLRKISPELSREERLERLVSDISIDCSPQACSIHEEIKLLSPKVQISPRLSHISYEHCIEDEYDPFLQYPSPTELEPTYNIFNKYIITDKSESPNCVYQYYVSPSPSPPPLPQPSRSPQEFLERVKQHEYTSHHYDQIGNKSKTSRASVRPRLQEIKEVIYEEYPRSSVVEDKLVELESPTIYEKAVREILSAAENQYLELLDSPSQNIKLMDDAYDRYPEINPLIERYDKQIYNEKLQRGLLDPGLEWKSPPREPLKLPELRSVSSMFSVEYYEPLDYTILPQLYKSPRREYEAYGFLTDQDIFDGIPPLIISPKEKPRQIRLRTPSPRGRALKGRSPIVKATGLKPAVYPNLPPQSAHRIDRETPLPVVKRFIDYKERKVVQPQLTPLSSRTRSPTRRRDRMVKRRISFDQPEETSPARVSKSPQKNIIEKVVDAIVEIVPENEGNARNRAGGIGRSSPEFTIEDISEEDEINFKWIDRQ